MSVLYGSEAVAIATTLKDHVRQLEILGKIMPYSYIEQPEVLDILNGEVEQILMNNMNVETRFHHVLEKYSDAKGLTNGEKDQLKKQINDASQDLKATMQTFGRGLRQNPLSADNIKKIQEERLFLQEILQNTAIELEEEGTFSHLIKAVESELGLKERMQNVVISEEESRQRIRRLRREIEAVKVSEREEEASRRQMVAHLKDQLQEGKARAQMEIKYERALWAARVSSGAAQCGAKEAELRTELTCLAAQTDNEARAHLEMEGWLRQYLEEVALRTGDWEHRHRDDTETLRRQLHTLAGNKARDLQRLNELTTKCLEYKDVVIKDRLDKEKLLREKQKEALEIESSLKIQCWWRTMCARLLLGPYGKKKGKKGKKGKKSKGGKKGKKGKKKK